MGKKMEKNARIYVAGHMGMVGSAIKNELEEKGFTNILTSTSSELDLTNQKDTKNFFEKERPEYVFLCAAKVGGIHANDTLPAEFITLNLQIQTNVIHAAWKQNVKKLMFFALILYPIWTPLGQLFGATKWPRLPQNWSPKAGKTHRKLKQQHMVRVFFPPHLGGFLF